EKVIACSAPLAPSLRNVAAVGIGEYSGLGQTARLAERLPPEKGPPMSLRFPLSRRRFVQALAASPFLAPMRAAETPRFGGSRLGLGIIGMGTRARQLLGSFLRDPGVQVVAVCDVVRQRREHGQKL